MKEKKRIEKKRKEENNYHYYYKNYLQFIKQTLIKIYKTFKSFESVKNVHLCHRVKTDEVGTNVLSTDRTIYAGTDDPGHYYDTLQRLTAVVLL